jgi:hypothetical protein
MKDRDQRSVDEAVERLINAKHTADEDADERFVEVIEAMFGGKPKKRPAA